MAPRDKPSRGPWTDTALPVLMFGAMVFVCGLAYMWHRDSPVPEFTAFATAVLGVVGTHAGHVAGSRNAAAAAAAAAARNWSDGASSAPRPTAEGPPRTR